MPFVSLPTEIHLAVVEDLDAATKLALAATNQQFRELIHENYDFSTLVKNAMIDFEAQRGIAGIHRGWGMQLSWKEVPCYSCLKILPRLHFRWSDCHPDECGTRICMTCRFEGKIDGSSRTLRLDGLPWLYCHGCKIIVLESSSTLAAVQSGNFSARETRCYKCLQKIDHGNERRTLFEGQEDSNFSDMEHGL